MPYNLSRGVYSASNPISFQNWSEKPDCFLSYGGWNLERAKESFVQDKIDLEELEMIVELVLLEESRPGENHQIPGGEGALIQRNMKTNFYQIYEATKLPKIKSQFGATMAF